MISVCIGIFLDACNLIRISPVTAVLHTIFALVIAAAFVTPLKQLVELFALLALQIPLIQFA